MQDDNLFDFVELHQERERACGDHNIQACSCGEPNHENNLPILENNEIAHNFRWEVHFKEQFLIWRNKI